MENNAEVLALEAKLGPLDPVKILAYITAHFAAVRSGLCDIETTWNKADYKGAGV